MMYHGRAQCIKELGIAVRQLIRSRISARHRYKILSVRCGTWIESVGRISVVDCIEVVVTRLKRISASRDQLLVVLRTASSTTRLWRTRPRVKPTNDWLLRFEL